MSLILGASAIVLLTIYLTFDIIKKLYSDYQHLKLLPIRKLPLTDILFSDLRQNKFFQLLTCVPDELQPVCVAYFGIPFLYAVEMTNPDDVKEVLGPNNQDKGPMHQVLAEAIGDGILTSNGDKYVKRRKLVNPAFHINVLKGFIKIFNKNSNLFVDHLKVMENQDIDVLYEFRNLMLNNLIETALGVNYENNKEDVKKYANRVEFGTEYVLRRMLAPWLQFKPFNYLTFAYYKEMSYKKFAHKFISGIIDERKKNFEKFYLDSLDDELMIKKKRFALLDVLLLAERNSEIDYEGIEEEINVFSIAGFETTSSTISLCCLMLANHPDVQERVYHEIISKIKDPAKDITYDDLNNLTYMEMVLKETLRYYPITLWSSRKLHNDMKTKNGFTIPKGTEVIVQIYTIHHNAKYYPNPEQFDPERFSNENSMNRRPFSYIPFGVGQRACIGQKYAILVMKRMLYGIVRNFEISPIDTPETIELLVGLVLKVKNGIHVTFKQRQAS